MLTENTVDDIFNLGYGNNLGHNRQLRSCERSKVISLLYKMKIL